MNDIRNVGVEILDILQVCCGQFIQEKPGVTSIIDYEAEGTFSAAFIGMRITPTSQ